MGTKRGAFWGVFFTQTAAQGQSRAHHTQQKHHMKIGVLLPQAEELPEDKKEAWNRLFLKTPRENMLPKPPFCTSGNCETVSFCCPKTPVCASLLEPPWDLTQRYLQEQETCIPSTCSKSALALHLTDLPLCYLGKEKENWRELVGKQQQERRDQDSLPDFPSSRRYRSCPLPWGWLLGVDEF